MPFILLPFRLNSISTTLQVPIIHMWDGIIFYLVYIQCAEYQLHGTCIYTYLTESNGFSGVDMLVQCHILLYTAPDHVHTILYRLRVYTQLQWKCANIIQ